jgi:hypothetical protein
VIDRLRELEDARKDGELSLPNGDTPQGHESSQSCSG